MEAHRLSIAFLLFCGIAEVLCRTANNRFEDVEVSSGISRVARGVSEEITQELPEGNVIHDQPEIRTHIIDKATSWGENARASFEKMGRMRQYASELVEREDIGPEYKAEFADFYKTQIGIQNSELKTIDQSITAADHSVADAAGDQIADVAVDAAEHQVAEVAENAVEQGVAEVGEGLLADVVAAIL